jgi:hypothetical protein
MAHQLDALFSVLGLVTWGDIGPFTVYRNKRGRLVWYPKAPPTTLPSDFQTFCRDKFRAAGGAWSALAEPVQRNWEEVSLKAHLGITGYNLFTYWHITQDRATIATLEHQTGITLLP